MDCQKEKFSLTETIHYLNCAYKAPLLKKAEEATVNALIRERNPTLIGVPEFFNPADSIRAEFAQLINCKTDQVALIPSTLYGFGSVLNNVPAKKEGHAITISDEFPSGYFSIERWCNENANELVVVQPNSSTPTGSGWSQAIIDCINAETSVVLISSIHWMNGLKFDLEAIGKKCAAVNAIFVVDGTQSVGALPMDVNRFNIDALICASYKWLFGPHGLGLAFIGEKFNQGRPMEESWMNRINAREFSTLTQYENTYRPGATRYNVGETSNFILTPLLLEGLRQVNAWKPENIQEYCKNLTQPLFDYMSQLGVEADPERVYHLFSLQLPKGTDQNRLQENLKANNVYVSIRGEHIRVSVNVFNNQKDIEQLIDAIKKTIDR